MTYKSNTQNIGKNKKNKKKTITQIKKQKTTSGRESRCS
jgi:hypothetical protein